MSQQPKTTCTNCGHEHCHMVSYKDFWRYSCQDCGVTYIPDPYAKMVAKGKFCPACGSIRVIGGGKIGSYTKDSHPVTCLVCKHEWDVKYPPRKLTSAQEKVKKRKQKLISGVFVEAKKKRFKHYPGSGLPAWVKCPDCRDEYVCSIHQPLRAHECSCPPIEVWDAHGINPYRDGGKPFNDPLCN